jgi:hypothetical protein
MAFGLPKMGDLTAQLNTRFEEMMTVLRAILEVLQNILGELRTQRGAP